MISIYRLSYIILFFIFTMLTAYSIDNLKFHYFFIGCLLIISLVAILDFIINRLLIQKRSTNLYNVKIREIYNILFINASMIFITSIYSELSLIKLNERFSGLNEIYSDPTHLATINNYILKSKLSIGLTLLILLFFFIDFVLSLLPLTKCYEEGIVLRNNTLLSLKNIEKISYTQGAVIKSNYIITIHYINKYNRSKEYKLISSKKSIDSFIDYINLKTSINIEFIK